MAESTLRDEIRDQLREWGDSVTSVARLSHGNTGDPRPKSEIRRHSTDIYEFNSGADRHRPPKDDFEKYWELFEEETLVREPIVSFASEIVEEGWYIKTDDSDLQKDLTHWLSDIGILEGEKGKNLSEILKKIAIQREVRGTVLVEKVRDEEGRLAGLKLIRPETVAFYTKPDSSILVEPDDTEYDHVKITEDGEAAAYVQYDDELIERWTDNEEIPFTREEVIKITRDADIGEIFGTSRLEAVYQRAKGLQQKLEDNDAAVSQTAFPFWLFKFGSEDEPWNRSDVEDFMEEHDFDNFRPGMKQGVTGNVDVETVGGDVAEIYRALQFDVDKIVSGMPAPKYSLGGFEENINQFVSEAQERKQRRTIKETRRELENELTPFIVEKANEIKGNVTEDGEVEDGLTEEDVELVIGRPDKPDDMDMVSGSTIRYISDAGQNGQGVPMDGPQQGNEDDQPIGDVEPGEWADWPNPGYPDDDDNRATSDTPFQSTATTAFAPPEDRESLWEAVESIDGDIEELADPRFISTRDEFNELRQLTYDALEDGRDRVLRRLENRFNDAPITFDNRYEELVSATIRSVRKDHRLSDNAHEPLRSVANQTVEKVNGPHHSPQLDASLTLQDIQVAESNARGLEDDVENALEEFAHFVGVQVQQGFSRGEDMSTILDRIRDRFSDSRLRQRASLMALMRSRSTSSTIRLSKYEASDEVIGVRVINPCNEKTTRLCKHLAGCGPYDGAEAYFDDGPIGEQLADDVPDEAIPKGFRPLPPSPPFHFGCRSDVVPIAASNTDD